MNMDKKIRQAFRNATPGAAQTLPAPAQKEQKKKRTPGKLWESLPTAASVAILVGALIFGGMYFRDYLGGLQLSRPTDPATQPTTEPSTPPTDPEADLQEQILTDALSIVAQEGEQLNGTVVPDRTECYGYKVTIQREGIIYRLYYTVDGGLYRVKEERTAEAAGPMPASVAYAIAWTSWGQKPEAYTAELKTAPQGFPYYKIQATAPEQNWEGSWYVHGETGEVYLYDPDDTEDRNQILTDALSIVALDGEMLEAEITEISANPNNYMVTVERRGILYDLYYARSGQLQKLELTRTPQAQGNIPENVAVRLVELNLGGEYQLQSLELKTSDQWMHYYEITMKWADKNREVIRFVDALNGKVYQAFRYLEEGAWADHDTQPAEGMVAREDVKQTALAYLGDTDKEAQCWLHGEKYTVVADCLGLVKIVQVDAWTGEILSWRLRDIVEGGVKAELEFRVLRFEDAFINKDHFFHSLEELRIAQFLANGFRNESTEPTAEERAALADLLPGLDSAALIRIPAEKLRELLRCRFDTTPEALNQECFEGMVYLESTDCWYFTNPDRKDYFDGWVTDVEQFDNGIFHITYLYEEDFWNDPQGEQPRYRVVAQFIPGGSWKILSNEKAE